MADAKLPAHAAVSPVALLLFNRPDTTAAVFEAIRCARPPVLLLIADGPRENRPGEADRCAAARAVVERVDWPCEILRNFSDSNLGCGVRVSTGINWIFEQVERAIILEDDCVPVPSFFPYCDKLLERFADDERVMMLSGTNVLGEWKPEQQSYHFSKYGAIWGWASWRRAWRHYDFDVQSWSRPEAKRIIRSRFQSDVEYRHAAAMFDKVFNHSIDTWDYQWTFACLLRGGLSAVSSRNLISNMGFGPDATHTRSAASVLAQLKTGELTRPFRPPQGVEADREYDAHFYRLAAGDIKPPLSLARRLARRAKRFLAAS